MCLGEVAEGRRPAWSVLVMKAVSSADVVPVERGATPGSYVLADYIGSYAKLDGETGFQAFMVHQRTPELRAHFHEVDQFQIVVDGSGQLGGAEIGVGAVHYTDGYTAYGPIRTADPDGVAYLTLRAQPAIGINYMPESRRKRADAHAPGGHFTCAVALAPDSGPGLALLAESARGARAYSCHLTPGAALTIEDVERAGGRGYAVVLCGATRIHDQALPSKSVIAFERSAELAGLSAVDRLATLALVTFPDAA
jgi:hypothetical protein